LLASFFFTLRKQGVPVTLTEWLVFMEALAKGLAWSDAKTFYALARSLLVKDVAYYDIFDQVFLHIFKDAELSETLKKDVEDWLNDPLPMPHLSEEELKLLEAMDFDRLREEFENRLREQDSRHDGGDRWIGTGGRSPFGHSGVNPAGIRVGGEGGMHSAVQVASLRRFKNYRQDVTLDIRQMKVALKKLRVLERVGVADELDVGETIDETCKNAGELELIFRPERKNRMKLLLLMDAGGSMDPYARLVNRLFSAASQMNHFKGFKHYYFHNCLYEEVFEDIYLDQRVATGKLFSDLDASWRVILVGDAAMAPSELTSVNGAIYYYHRNETPGLVWLKRVREHFRKTVWLNPIPKANWWSYTIAMVGKVFPMFPLTVDGLEEAVGTLR